MIDYLYVLSGVVLLAAQIACFVHLVRHHRSFWWILPLLLFPLLGTAAYFFLEIWPHLGVAGRERVVPFGSAAGTGRESVRQLERLVEVTPTIENRTRLAGALLRKGATGRAVELYEGCLEGFHAADRTLWYELAEAYHADGQLDRSLEYLRKLEEEGFRDYRERRELLYALALEARGEIDRAVPRLQQLVSRFPGQEANFHYARLLHAQGRDEAARVVAEGMLQRRRDHDARYRRREARWYEEAKKLLRELS